MINENKIKEALAHLETAVQDAETSSKNFFNGELNMAFMVGFLKSRIKGVVVDLNRAAVEVEEVKVSMIIQSHLSDIVDMVNLDCNPVNTESKIEFVKWLVLNYPDTNVRIDPDHAFKQFLDR